VDDTAIIATSRQPALLVTSLETYLNVLERWLRERRIAFNVSESTAMLFAKAGRRILWVETVHCLGVTLDKRLASSTQSGTETRNVGTSLQQEEWSLLQEWSSAV